MINLDNDDAILLAKACNENCKKSTESLYIKFKPETNNNLHKSLSQKDLDDSIQELFVRLMDNKLKFKGKGNPKGFLKKTIKNIHHEQFNNDKLNFHSLQQMENDGIFPIDKNARIPLQILESEELKRIISVAISQLPTKSRQALALVYLDGIPAKRTAESIGCEFRVFRNRLKYAKKKLSEMLKKYYFT